MQHTYQDLATVTPNTVLSTPQLTTNSAVLILTDAVVARGQRAWHRIKATAAEQRELWREVGEALLVGRRMHKADQKFSQWCKEMGFGDLDRHDRADAMWLASVWSEVCDRHTPADLSHPSRIRRWFNEQQHTALLPADLSDIQAESIETIELDERSAEKVAKLSRRAKAGDEDQPLPNVTSRLWQRSTTPPFRSWKRLQQSHHLLRTTASPLPRSRHSRRCGSQ